MNIKNQRTLYYDILRTIAMFLVIGVHAVGSITMYAPETTGYAVLIRVLENLNNLGVPIFFALSGRFLLSEKIDHIGQFYKKRLTKILIPFAIYAWVYIVYFTGIEQANPFGIPKAYVIGLLTNQVHPTHWFVYTILGFYLVTPFLSKMLQNMKDNEIAVMLGICIGCVFVQDVFSIFQLDFGIKDIVFNGSIYYFLSGYCICRLQNMNFMKNIKRFRWPLVLALCVIHIAVSWSAVEYMLIPLLMLPVEQKQVTGMAGKVVTTISRHSYSVYLIHAAVISALLKVYTDWTNGFAWKVFVIYIVVFAGAFSIAVVVDTILTNRIIQHQLRSR